MCNLYRTRKSLDEIARLFDANLPEGVRVANQPGEVYPGTPGTVVRGVSDGRQLACMVWGFPFAQKSKKTGKPLKPRPVNNTRTDKLDSFFWRYSFEERRCLIPLTHFAEAEGPKGAKTRTWFSAAGEDELLVAAGIWRSSDEWGDCYSMMMTEANGTVSPVHDRMPVLLRQEDWARWTDGSPQDARGLCLPFAGELAVDRTDQPWNAR